MVAELEHLNREPGDDAIAYVRDKEEEFSNTGYQRTSSARSLGVWTTVAFKCSPSTAYTAAPSQFKQPQSMTEIK